jgi:phenylpropionate dioxygenase-like ring-hydroxylating dioxygenase large terminal subunit
MSNPSTPAIKGVNRCDAVSYQELLAQDPVSSPGFLRTESSVDLGVEPIRADRYTSQEFFKREVNAVWLTTWQYVCRQEQLANAGDTHVFDLVGRSAIVVRQQDGGLRAFQNVCRHRGRKLATHNGCYARLRCPFHGFTWNIDGSFRENPMKWDFPQIDEARFGLPEIAVDSWGGFIFVNFKRNAPPLRSVAHPMPEHFEGWGIEDCYQSAHVAKVIPANWKAVVEAFIESHHVLTTHPQISPYTGDANSQYDILSDHVCRFITPLGTPSPLIDNEELTPRKLVETWFSKGSRAGPAGADDVFKEGDSPREFAARIARKTWSSRTGRDYSKVSQTELIDAISYNMFPAFSVWGGIGTHIGYRWRPWDGRVDRTLMETFLFAPVPAGAERPPPASMRLLADDEPWKNAPELGYLGPVYDQDQANLRPVQEGLVALADGVIQFGRYTESRCRHLHHMVDQYIREYEGI